MVTFFATLFVNILVGTIFYLIISLKFEKSSSDVHVKKMRREMDDMIREFNLTAERNITLLERKIEVMKRLLEKHGIDSALDLSDEEPGVSAKPSTSDVQKTAVHRAPAAPAAVMPATEEKGGLFKKLGNKIMHAIQEVPAVREIPAAKEENTATVKKSGQSFDVRVDGDVSLPKHRKIAAGLNEQSPSKIASADIKTAFALADNRKEIYELISYYYDSGTSVEELSRVSGIPVGEINLVVSLKSRKG
jgi:hypothetical protein